MHSHVGMQSNHGRYPRETTRRRRDVVVVLNVSGLFYDKTHNTNFPLFKPILTMKPYFIVKSACVVLC